jgi:membrane protein implicated in regulation of membrane protease activity
MNWETFYLVAFAVGFLLSALSFLAGAIRMPHFHFHGHAHGHGLKAGRGGLSPLNIGTVAAFLAWFGGTGYILERHSNLWIFLGLFVSIMSGLGGAAIIFWFLKKLTGTEAPLDPADYDMVGVLGSIGSPVRGGGTGELLYSRGGTRRAVAARSEDGVEIPRNAEVIVIRYEKGVAYVRRWEEMSGERY